MPGVSRLNRQTSLFGRLTEQLAGASRFDVAVAFARATGVWQLLKLGLPARSHFVIGFGFAITEPAAVEALADTRRLGGGIARRYIADEALAHGGPALVIALPRSVDEVNLDCVRRCTIMRFDKNPARSAMPRKSGLARRGGGR